MEGQARLGILQPFLGEAPEISSTATLPFPQIRGKEGTLNPKVASALVGSLDEVGQDQAVCCHSLAGSGMVVEPGRRVAYLDPAWSPHPQNACMCQGCVHTSLRDHLVSVALPSAKALSETAGAAG